MLPARLPATTGWRPVLPRVVLLRNLQHVIQTVEQMRNRFLRFVAHVREAESLAADLSITGIDHQMVLFPQPPREPQHVDAFVVFDARQCLCAEPFFSEEIEPGVTYPVMHERIGADVPSVTRFEAFLENFIELGFERMNVSDARRAWRHPLGLLASELQEIEIKSAIL